MKKNARKSSNKPVAKLKKLTKAQLQKIQGAATCSPSSACFRSTALLCDGINVTRFGGGGGDCSNSNTGFTINNAY